MENEIKDITTDPISTQSTPVSPQTTGHVNKKISPWVWVISGCLIITILAIGSIVFLGWWSYHKAKKAVEDQAPYMQEFKGKLEEMNIEAEKWNQEAQELQDSLPNPDEITYPLPSSEETQLN
jgi:Tfp pilus assembly protein PilO